MVNSETADLDFVFHALADATRRQMLVLLRRGNLTISELAKPFEMSLVAISKHIRVLEKANLVRREKRGRSWYCEINREALMTAQEWIEHYTEFWESRFELLDEVIKNNQEN